MPFQFVDGIRTAWRSWQWDRANRVTHYWPRGGGYFCSGRHRTGPYAHSLTTRWELVTYQRCHDERRKA